ncbi:MAG: ATP-binding protein [Bacteroidota bacterium]
MEKIKIENFAGIKSMEFEFKAINILIGPQGSGKSIAVKLLYFFKNFFGEILRSVDSEETKRELDKKQKEIFVNFFPKDSWPKGNFKIVYSLDSTTMSIEKTTGILNFKYSENLIKAISKSRKIFANEKKKISDGPKSNSFTAKRKLNDKLQRCFIDEISPISMFDQYFIPAGRSFFANIQKNIFSFLSDNRSLDPFLVEFGSFYENFKRYYKDFISNEPDKHFDEIISQILNSDYFREKDKDFLIHSDYRKVNLSNASSGQQETLPLVIILRVLNILRFSGGGATIYIEEPEAHLFPIAQKRIVQLLARTFNNKNTHFQIIVTTHSPYILSSFNTLLQAGRLNIIKPEKNSQISKVVPKEEQLNPDLLRAYSLNMGKREILEDDESKLISQTVLDSVSNDISKEFGQLLDIEF